MRRSTRNYAIAIAFSVAFIGYQLWPADPPETIVVSKPDPVMTEAEAFAAARAELGLESVPDTRAMQRVEQSLRTDTLLSIEQIDADLAAVMQLGEFGVVRERLLQYAHRRAGPGHRRGVSARIAGCAADGGR
jgi:hypothetical protein